MKKIIRWLFSSVLVAAMGIASLAAWPQAVQADSLESGYSAPSADADLIIVGSVQGLDSRWNSDHTRIYTSVSVRPEEALKGSTGSDCLTITVPGGKVGEITQVVSDTPAFSRGERMIVSLSRMQDGTYGVHGDTQGKISVGTSRISASGDSIERLKQQIRSSGKIGGATLDIASPAPVAYSEAGAPLITAVNPPSASAGTNTQITISGSGFGAYKGTVYFFYRIMQNDIPGTVVSWTDSRIAVTVPVAIVDGYPASASSGTIAVKTAAGVQSSYFPFAVTFSYGGMKWSGTSPVVNYYVNPNTTDTTGEEVAIRNAATSWSTVSGSAFSFNYAGATAATGYGYNGRNEMMWVNMGATSIIARAAYWYSGASMVEADIEFNDYYNWNASSTGVSGKMDVESIALHELGHWLCLRDLYGNISGYPMDSAKVMYGFGSTGSLKRTLSAEDQAGIQWIYPGAVVSSIAVTSPNGGETWQAGTDRTITWSYSGSPGNNVKIELYKAGLLAQTVTPGVLTGNGSYSWNPPVSLENGNDYKVKITSLTNGNYNDSSNNEFTITGGALPPGITVSSPNGGESFQAGTNQGLTWSYTGNPGSQVSITLLDGQSTALVIASSTPTGVNGNGSFDWTVPFTLYNGNSYRIIITSITNSLYSDASDGAFALSGGVERPTITLTSPNGGETWQAGKSKTINWIYSGNPGSAVALDLYRSGTFIGNIVASTSTGSGNTGSYIWNIPTSLTATGGYQIVITSSADSRFSDSSDAAFNISAPPAPTITVTGPNGGESWQAGTVHTITWTYFGSIGTNVKIQLYKGGNLSSTIVSSTAIGSGGSGSYTWTLASTLTSSSTCAVKVSSISNTAYFDYSDAYFTVTPVPLPGIRVTAPNGGETWKAGTAQTVTWSYTGNPGSMVKIQLYKNGSLNRTLTYGTSISSGSYTWTIPASQAASSVYKIKITSTSNSTYYDSSDNNFTIGAPVQTTLKVTSPNTSQVWRAGTRQTITWTYSGNPGSSVRIELLKNGVLTRTISSSTSAGSAGSGTYYWTLPTTLIAGADYRIRVLASSDSTIVDTSDINFSITK
jgi:hypothetical protein